MKKFLFRLSVFCILTFAAQYITYFAIKKALDKKSQFRLTRYFRAPKHKYFVIGNSRGLNSINEKYANETLKIDLINLSVNGEPYKNALNILDDINERNKNSVIFLEITCLNKNYFDHSYSYYISDSKILRKAYAGKTYNWLHLLRLNNELFLRNIYYLKKSDNDGINKNTITKNMIDHIKIDSSFRINDNEGIYLNRLTTLQKICDDHGNKLIFFLTPFYPEYLSKITDYNSTIQFMNVNKTKFNFVNLNNIKLPDYMFADRIHTNYKGSVPLTRALIDSSKYY